MANIIDFYRRVVDSIGMSSDDEGYIYAGKGDNKVIMVVNNKSLVIPTKEQLKTTVEKNDEGELEVVKLPFNPLNEDVVKGDSVSLKKTKVAIEKNLGHALACVGELLLLLGNDKTSQTKTSMDVNKFLKLINEVKTPQNSSRGKQVVDERMVENWDKLYAETLKNVEGIIKISLIKGGKVDGVKHNRVASLISPLYDSLIDADPDTPVLGIKLRKKDIELYKLLIEYLIPGIEENRVIHVASDDKISPAFISLMKLYLPLMNRYNKINKEIGFVNQSTADSGYIEIAIEEDELDNLKIYSAELSTIPDENDINREKVKRVQTSIATVDPSSYNTAPVVNTGNAILDDAIKASSTPAVQPMVQQPVMQQPVMQQPMVQQPVMQQNMYQQPMVQPNMYQQPMIQQQTIDPVLAAGNQALAMGVGVAPAYPAPIYGGNGFVAGGYAPNRYVQPTIQPRSPYAANPYVTPAYRRF